MGNTHIISQNFIYESGGTTRQGFNKRLKKYAILF